MAHRFPRTRSQGLEDSQEDILNVPDKDLTIVRPPTIESEPDKTQNTNKTPSSSRVRNLVQRISRSHDELVDLNTSALAAGNAALNPLATSSRPGTPIFHSREGLEDTPLGEGRHNTIPRQSGEADGDSRAELSLQHLTLLLNDVQNQVDHWKASGDGYNYEEKREDFTARINSLHRRFKLLKCQELVEACNNLTMKVVGISVEFAQRVQQARMAVQSAHSSVNNSQVSNESASARKQSTSNPAGITPLPPDISEVAKQLRKAEQSWSTEFNTLKASIKQMEGEITNIGFDYVDIGEFSAVTNRIRAIESSVSKLDEKYQQNHKLTEEINKKQQDDRKLTQELNAKLTKVCDEMSVLKREQAKLSRATESRLSPIQPWEEDLRTAATGTEPSQRPPRSTSQPWEDTLRAAARGDSLNQRPSSSPSIQPQQGENNQAKSDSRSLPKETPIQGSRQSTPFDDDLPILLSHELNEANLDSHSLSLKHDTDYLVSLLNPLEISDQPKSKVTEAYKSLNEIQTERRDISQKCDQYVTAGIKIEEEVLEYVRNCLRFAKGWIAKLQRRYKALDCDKKRLKVYDTLAKFSRGSEMSIFEFLKRFETMTEEEGSETSRAELLFCKHLDAQVQEESRKYKDSYSNLRKWLLKTYGNVRLLTRNILAKIKAKKTPDTSANVADITTYYRTMSACLVQIDELRNVADIPVAELEDHIYSGSFLTELVNYLPSRTRNTYLDKIGKAGLDPSMPRGRKAFEILMEIVSRHFNTSRGYETIEEEAGRLSGKPKPKRDGKQSVHHQDQSPEPSQEKKKLKFPCPMKPQSQHNHEVGMCKEYFLATPSGRGNAAKGKACYSCLGYFSKCKNSCSNIEAVEKAQLTCPECTDWAKENKRSPRNLLFCSSKNHTKPSNDELLKRLKGYLKTFNQNLMGKDDIKLVSHTDVIPSSEVHAACSKASHHSINKPSGPLPAFDLESGKIVIPKKNQLLDEPVGEAFFIMQLLNMNGRDTLVFYDTGANVNLVAGRIAERLNFQLVDDQPVNIGTTGGGTISSQYGQYGAAIGPDEDGMYHPFRAQGIPKITRQFPKFQLSRINKEVTDHCPSLAKDTNLPEYIGGSNADLLIGVNNIDLQPVLVDRLPSGLGVFRSPVKDKFGANICYGGPHPTFSRKDSNAHLSVFFTKFVQNYLTEEALTLTRTFEPVLEQIESGLYNMKDDQFKQSDHMRQIVNNPTSMIAHQAEDLETHVAEPTEMICICSIDGSIPPCAYKARVSASKQKEYLDTDDLSYTPDIRCEKCKVCSCRLKTAKQRMQSIQEIVEQDTINKSVKVNLEEQETKIEMPFTKDPIKFLKDRHNGQDSNYKQARRVFTAQCRKSDSAKQEMIKVHKELVDSGFLKKLSDMEPHRQEVVNSAPFRHFMPWKSVAKPGSVSTPYRMVVDATMTGLNEVLCKGSNNESKIPSILMRSRTRKEICSSDVRKLYNQMKLEDSALPYSLLLFSDNLDPQEPPVVYCMQVAWYGVTPTGNQAGAALQRLVEIQKDKYPAAVSVVNDDRYVDDIISGAQTKEELEAQIKDTQEALEAGGFHLKYVVRSGEPPCEKASSDGIHVGMLGYKWNTQQDVVGLSFKELNFYKKSRGKKQDTPFEVTEPEHVKKLLSQTVLTRRMIIGKIGEIHDPLGLFEPYKVQLKIEASELKIFGWDEPLPDQLQQLWTSRFIEFLEVPDVTASRCVVPENAIEPNKIRIIGVADAGESMVGCALYATYLLPDGTYSCKLLSARSKRSYLSIPRNELESICMLVDACKQAKEALFHLETEFTLCTDSIAAMCWVQNTAKKLRLFTLNRVIQIRQGIMAVTGCEGDKLPLYHISGKNNVADLLTKRHKILPLDLCIGSRWETGSDWMKLPVDEMQLTEFADITVNKDENATVESECFPELLLSGELNHLNDGQSDRSAPVPDIIQSNDESCSAHSSSKQVPKQTFSIDLIRLGWQKSLTILARILKLQCSTRHRLHVKQGSTNLSNCTICKILDYDSQEKEKVFIDLAKKQLFREESAYLKRNLSSNCFASFVMQDGILLAESRLIGDAPFETVNLTIDPFYDTPTTKDFLPVVSANSPLFFAYTMHIHLHVRQHAGIERTMREIYTEMYVIDNPRRVIKQIRLDCTKCRLLAKRTLELRMAHHPAARTTISPPFYHVQIDVVFGFKMQSFINARKTFTGYALIVVCLLTSATNVLALEGLDTQQVVLALERHGSRYGMPAVIYVDNGTQLVSLKSAEFSLRCCAVQLQDSMKVDVRVSTAKSHESQGRCEAKVKVLREMLNALTISSSTAMTALQWETLLSKLSNQMDSLPICKTNGSNVNDPYWNLITPNRLKLGHNNFRTLEGPIELVHSSLPSRLLKKNKDIQEIWYCLLLDRIHHLIPRPRKWSRTDPISIGDIVVFVYDDNPVRKIWKIGRVVSIPKRTQLEIEFPSNQPYGRFKLYKLNTITRNPRCVSVIFSEEEIELNTEQYHESIILSK